MDWWHEDPELLSATLYMLAAAEDDPQSHFQSLLQSQSQPPPVPQHPNVSPIASLSSPSTTDETESARSNPSASPKTSTRNGSRPKVVNVSRERRRDETRYLRGKVAELEAQLSILQHRREQMLRPHRTETGEIRTVAAVWEALATRQVREVKRSELMNAKLKTMVENQLRVAEDLMLAIRTAEEESRRQCDQSDGIVTLARPRLAIDISQKISEEDQLVRLEILCTQWREAFSWSPRFRDGSSFRFIDVQLVRDNGVDAVVDVFGSWALPFSRDKVENIFWKFYLEENAEIDGNTFAQDYVSKDDTIIGVFHALSTIDNHRTTFDGKYVGKRMRSPEGHMMVISHMYSEPKCKSNLLEDVAIEEDSWMRIVDSHAVGGPALTYPLTLLQHVRRVYIRFGLSADKADVSDSPESVVRRHAGALTEFLMLQVEDELTRGEQCVENMLLDAFGNMSVTPTLTLPDFAGDSMNV